MLDMGFEKEMNQCLDLIKKKCPNKFIKNDDAIESIKDEEKKLKVQKFLSK